MSTQTQVAPANQVRNEMSTVQQALEKMKGQFAMALPAHIKPERMIRVALTAVQNTPKLLECDRNSFYLAVLRAAQLGLEPDGILGQAYLIPYGKTVQLIPGYKGLIDLARRSGEVSNIIAKEVYANDEFTVDWAREIPFSHVPKMEGDRGEVKFFWALARFKDGGFHWDYMSKADVEKVRDKSQGAKNPVWKDYFIEMGKKTVIRRIAKYLPMSVQRAAVVEDMMESGKSFTTDQFGEILIEAEQPPAVVAPVAKLDEFAGAAKPEAANEDQQVPAYLRQPRVIGIKPLATDANKTDWKQYSVDFMEALKHMADGQSVEKLRTINDKNMQVLYRDEPDLYSDCLEAMSIRMTDLGAVQP